MSVPKNTEKDKRGQFKRKPITKLIIDNEASPNPLGPAQLADISRVPLTSIYRVMSRLRREGRIKGGHGPNTHIKGGIPVDYAAIAAQTIGEVVATQGLSPEITVEAVESVLSDSVMGLSEQLRRLTEFARHPSPMVAMKAIDGLASLQRGTGSHIGPPTPLTEEERVARLTPLMRACGKATVNAAYLIAFPVEAPLASEEAENSTPREEPADSGNTLA